LILRKPPHFASKFDASWGEGEEINRRTKLFDLMQNKHAVHRGEDAIPNSNGNE
jgi:hypothetical protein